MESRLASSLQGVEMRTRVRLNVAARTEGLRDMRSVGCGWMCTRRGRMRIDGRVVVREVGSLEAQMTLQDERPCSQQVLIVFNDGDVHPHDGRQ